MRLEKSVNSLSSSRRINPPPTHDPPAINAEDWPKTMETPIEEYLRSYLGERKIPLAYVVQKNDGIPEGDNSTTSYPTIQDEMITKALHYSIAADGTTIPDPIYLINREKVWDIISKITRELSSWTYVKPAQRSRDGHLVFMSLYEHFLGPNNVDNYQQRQWDFERFVNVHKKQHSITEGLVEHSYTPGIDPRSKVRYYCLMVSRPSSSTRSRPGSCLTHACATTLTGV
jgi:hypothetical protein